MDLKTPPGALYEGEPQGTRPGCTMTLSDDDFVALATGELNPQQVLYNCRIKVMIIFLGIFSRKDQDHW